MNDEINVTIQEVDLITSTITEDQQPIPTFPEDNQEEPVNLPTENPSSATVNPFYSGISGYSGYSGYLGQDGISGYSGISGFSGIGMFGQKL